MRKSSLVKAMACFMAATMAVTCVPGVNVTNGVAVVAEAAETVTVPEPQAKFEFGENGLKDSISNNVATLTGDLVTADATKETASFTDDGALLLDGTYGVKLPESAVPTGDKYTISYKVKVNSSSQYSSQIFLTDKADVNNYVNIGRGWQEEGIFMAWSHLAEGELWGDSVAGAIQSTGEEHIYTVVVDNTSITIYCDGSKISSDENCKYINSGNSDIYLGVNAWNPPFNGEISSLEIYNSALTEEQVLATMPTNNCTGIKLEDTGNSVSSPKLVPVGDFFTFNVNLTGTKTDDSTVTDIVTAAAVTVGAITENPAPVEDTPEADKLEGVEIESIERNGNTATIKVTTSKEPLTGAIKISCGEAVAVYYFQSQDNKCDSLIVSDGGATQIDQGVYSISTPITTIDGKLFSFNIRATSSTNKTMKLTDRIERVNAVAADGETEVEHTHYFKKGGVKYYPTGILSTGLTKTILDGNGVLEEQYVAHVYQGNNDFLFKCGDNEIVVRIVGTDGSTSTGTPSSPSTDNTTTDTPTDDTPDTTTPGAVTPDTPSTDNNTPSTDNNTPSTDNNTPSTDNNNTLDDNNDDTETKTTKKKAKVASVTAKKGKKVVSGTVKISATGKKVSKATVKVYVNSKKKVTVKTKSTGKFTAKLSKKLKKGDKVKLVITKSNIKKITKTVKVK